MTEEKNEGLHEELDDQKLDQEAGGIMMPPVITMDVNVLCGPTLTIDPDVKY